MGMGSRPWLAGLAMGVAGLVAGGALGAWVGAAASPAATPTPSTTVPAPAPIDAVPGADPLPLPDPGVFWDGLSEGALVAIADLPDDRLLVVADGLLQPMADDVPGRVVALGRGRAVLAASDGLRMVAPDGVVRLVPTSGAVQVRGEVVAWTATGPRGPEVRVIDLATDDPTPRPLAPAPTGGLAVTHVDRSGAVLSDGTSASWVVGPTATWPVPADEAVAALLGDRVALTADTELIWRDRATGAPTDALEPPVGARDCLPVEALARTVLWACSSGFSVTSPWGSSSGAGERADLLDGGESVIWYQPNDEGPDLARVLHLPSAKTASVGSSDLPIRAVAP